MNELLLDEDFVVELVYTREGADLEGVLVLRHAMTGTSRWATEHVLIVRVDDQCWSLEYRQPATEMQEDMGMFERYGLTWHQVTPQEVTKTVFVDNAGKVVA